MSLSDAQKVLLKADILANTAPINGTPINAMPNSADANYAIAAWYNQLVAPAYWAWGSDVAIESIFDQVTWANYTPQDVADATIIYQNRAMLCQTKQMNLQIMLQGRSTFNAAKASLRSGLNDATTALPSGPLGANRTGGWANILPILRRQATNSEKVFAVAGSGIGNAGGDARGATTNPDVMTREGLLSPDDIEAARNS